ncbi:MAG: hypothetical protein IIB77_10395 [Proteobacteria bacterium]|nr:hypothetical protein [Pseudomonadota bacterium]
MIGALVFAVIFAIKAKNEFQKHSEALDSSFDAFYLIEGKTKKGPYLLKEIRDSLGRIEQALADENVQRFVDGKEIRKVIVVPGRLVSIVV